MLAWNVWLIFVPVLEKLPIQLFQHKTWIMKRKFKQRWSSIPPISTKRIYIIHTGTYIYRPGTFICINVNRQNGMSNSAQFLFLVLEKKLCQDFRSPTIGDHLYKSVHHPCHIPFGWAKCRGRLKYGKVIGFLFYFLL